MGKIKIHEIAKELDLTSKEIIERATKLGIDVKNHLSSVEEQVAKKIEDSFKKVSKEKIEKIEKTQKTQKPEKVEIAQKADKPEKTDKEKKIKKDKAETPVIIRREVIISEEELAKRAEEEDEKKRSQTKKEVGFVERNTNKDFNIVYRNKPAKPLTVNELFGLKNSKKEEPVEEETVENLKEEKETAKTTKNESENMVKLEEETKKEIVQNEQSDKVNSVTTSNNQNQGYRNNANTQNTNGYNNQNQGFRKNTNTPNTNGYNNQNQGFRNNTNTPNSNGYNNQNQGFRNNTNTPNSNGYNNQNQGYRNNTNTPNSNGYNNQNQGFRNNTNTPNSNGYNNQNQGFRNNTNTPNNNGYNNQNQGYRNNNTPNNGGYNNQNQGYRNNNTPNNGGYNNQNQGYRNNNNNGGGYNNQNQGFRNNGQNNGYNGQRRPLDEKGIEKNIKNILTDVVEKEVVREYNRSMDKQKQNSRIDDKTKKNPKQRKTDRFDINEDKLKSLKQTDKLSNMFNEQDGGMLDFYDLTTQRGRKNRKRANRPEEERVKQKIFKLTEIMITDPVSVKDFAIEMKKTTGEVIKKLLGYGVLATINNQIDFDTAFLIAGEFGIVAVKKETVTEEDILFDETEDIEEELRARPPVVVVMGHVDHGKTSLLDTIRKTNVIKGEAGGITQHIGAYKVKIKDREITFLDTPGHEAFTSMRARGAQITDIAILVVAANDGVMPQTIEAISHAKAAEIPIIVALNKIDLEGANPEKVKQELTKYDLVSEEWGGDTIFVPISAKKGENIDTLLEMVILVADMKELKSNPKKQAKGAVIEAKLDKTRGPVATMLVQRGTLDVGDTIVVGSVIGRIRAMTDDKGKNTKKAGPSTPVEVIGLTEVPEAGDTFYEVKDEKTAKHLIERRRRQEREKSINATARVTLDDLFSQIEKGSLKQLNLIVKADVQGSVEAVKQSLEKLSDEEVLVKVIHSSVGGVTESDVTLANVSNAIIIAFNVRPDVIARDMAKKDEVEIKQYSIIYQAIEDVQAAMKGMLDPVFEEKVIGTAEVRQVFKVSNVGTVAGCYITDGKISRNAGIRVIRENVVIHDGKLISLKRFKDDAKEVAYGYECGLQIENYNDIAESDTLEVYIMEEVKK